MSVTAGAAARLALVYMRVAVNVAVGLGAGVSAGECWRLCECQCR